MVLKNVSAAILCTTLLVWSGASIADEYRPDEFLGLGSTDAVAEPTPPPNAPRPIETKAEPKPLRTNRIARAKPQVTTEATIQVTTHVAHARAEKSRGTRAKTQAKAQAKAQAKTQATADVAHARAEKPRGAARTKLVRRHGNPLDAQAFDTRIQAWPCKSGGICNWKR